MSQTSNIRLVRCPNCDHLLPETADYSVYICGGCATVLRGDTSSLRPENEVLETPALNSEVKNISETETDKLVGVGVGSDRGEIRKSMKSELLRKLDELLIMNEDSYQDHPFYNGCVRMSHLRRRQQQLPHYPNPNIDRFHFQQHRPCFNMGRYRNLNYLSDQPCGFRHRTHMMKTVPTTTPPLSGGAPFVTCCNCLELLQVPNSVLLLDKTRRKIKCWACSTTLLLRVVEKKLRVSVIEDITETLYHSRPNRARMNFSSQDYDNSGYDFHSIDWEVNSLGTSKSGSLASGSDEEFEPVNCLLEEKKTTHKEKPSSLAGLIKKSLKEKFSRTDQNPINVTVNGQPIPDRLLKKAEKIAGPIQPGNYWYDIKGGFWGLINGPCLGIIPPFIEELNHPIDKKCAGGNSGVFVNGRELHQKDLQLLSMRGLPTVRGRSYTIEISGRIWDDESGRELDSLGKLAPTVEMAKHGFGMKPPKQRV